MSMKYFTLSAVCVLVFGMLLALSAVTDLSGGSFGPFSPDHLVSGADSGASHQTLASAAELARVRIDSEAPLPRIADWNSEELGKPAPDPAPPAEKPEAETGLRFVGLLFIIGWVFLSSKLLSTD